MNAKPHCLIGKTLTGVKIADDKQALLFQTTDGDIVARCDADCCSYTWVENVDLPALGFPALVTAAENSDGVDLDTRDDELAFYGFKITTDRGEILIDYRNESNGYYGGSLVWPGDHYYGGVHNQNVSAQKWVDLPAVAAALTENAHYG